jgi:hypothetical protein
MSEVIMSEFKKGASPKVRPVLFSAPMIRALLEARKTQTRRPVLCLGGIRRGDQWAGPGNPVSGRLVYHDGGAWDAEVLGRDWGIRGPIAKCPYGQPGDLLWVRETWAHYHTINHIRRTDGRAFSEVSDGLAAYRADGFDTIDDLRDHIRLMSGMDLEAIEIRDDKWIPSIFMKRWASRLTLELTDVRVERLQDISTHDSIEEGIDHRCQKCGYTHRDANIHFDHDLCGEPMPTAPDAYRGVWETINGPETWDANPWVWALTFLVHQQNVDRVLERREAASATRNKNPYTELG